jgi:hypothetical protein
MDHVRRVFCIGALSLFLGGAAASAQLSTGQFSGRIADQSGAVLPGVTVTATQTETGFTRTVVTDADGSYVMPNLPTGPYRLEVSLEGFRSYVQTGIVLQVGATPQLNAVLEVGALAETVSVEASTPLVDVQSAGIGDVVENERILQLPLQGRNVTDLIVLAGAAVQASGGISVAGGLTYGVAYVVDGGMHNNPHNNLELPLPFPDALQEFRVATGGLSAESGVHSGASVNAVTKSGTNTIRGNIFEFLRDRRFNATNPFAQVGPDGKRLDDGLVRNQFGGTLGGPVVRDKLFFFGGYQGTIVRQTPAANISWVPTPAMLAGDFTAFASAACNGGREVALRAPFVNNRINPALFSPAAVNLARRLPSTGHPCGEITFSIPEDTDGGQFVGRVDYQLRGNQSLFGRYMATFSEREPGYAKTGNLLATAVTGSDSLVHSSTVGHTATFGSNMVNSLNLTINRRVSTGYQPPIFEPYDLGVDVYSYQPHATFVNVTPVGFRIGGSGGANHSEAWSNTYEVSDSLTVVRGRHQMGLGGNVAVWRNFQRTDARAGGVFNFDGQVSGLPLADLMLGRLSFLEHGGHGGVNIQQLYLGMFAQDTWRATDRLTFNAGLRWEPYFGQNARAVTATDYGAVYNFSIENFRQGVTSTVFHNAPAGFLYPGDPGFAGGTMTGLNRKWWNLSPRVGAAWDVTGDGRMAVRSSYSLSYDFPPGSYHFINSSAPPFGNRLRVEDPPGRFDNPYGHLGGDPHPIATAPDAVFPLFGSFGAIDPDINSPRVHAWNVTLERQVGSEWATALSYLGSAKDRLWGLVALNPGVYLGLGPCTIHGVAYPVCSTNANLNQRRVFFLENPAEAQFIGVVDQHTDVGEQTYHGLKVSVRRRAAAGISVNGNYTWSYCEGNTTPTSFSQLSAGYVDPQDPDYDRGHCDQDRTHLANLTIGAESPQFDSAALRILASNWRASGIVNVRSGSWLNVTTGRDNALTGMASQRPNQVSDELHGDGTLTNYLNRAAFAQPASGTLGDFPRNGVEGPGFWTIDLALSRLVSFGAVRSLEMRLEVFNLLNNFNWGNPNTSLSAATFGRITSTGGDPRIMQFGVKYGF